ncbi:CDF family Co(II)/Ni(II) efflux transporter DmeF [Marinobacterium sediminicola]|uniref:Cation diffusion facilitator family transporter n=1 Tax=Marinobacterium sediminicola TaxID=518898 RepID=A0ABY1RWF9_9GAMM|nr:CDF family Co(II)/Ni(II) efflux transporter DmeF [Marinobacterium sediminicola]ULG70449.1 CDF family Co(II)/Ni(II) efflux transporter DmeF [Marinobacterium sediminicola]SMR69301.1 cation diffusion facilitator family transporter [Marinobacterium sediminicola]
MSNQPPQSSVCKTADQLQHPHDFGQGQKRKAEQRATLVTLLTLMTMLVEVAAGVITGSMALLADGIHMAGHAMALGLAALAYYLSRKHAHDRRLSLGSGKIADLAAYTSALILGLSTLWLIYESVDRIITPAELMPREAMIVAVIGLAVNLVSALLLAGKHEHGHSHGDHEHHHDSNLSAALVHVLADALTSVAAIVGLGAAMLWGWTWVDPAIALVASVIILRWSWGLLRQTTSVLLDREGPDEIRRAARKLLQKNGDTDIIDLHIWSVGQGSWTLVAAVVAHGSTTPEEYRASLRSLRNLHHPIIEVSYCRQCALARKAG